MIVRDFPSHDFEGPAIDLISYLGDGVARHAVTNA